MDVQAFEQYLQIETNSYHDVDVKTLNHYLRRYMLTVPFENINVQNQLPISTEIDALFDKIVRHKRGGYCYEMNTLFQHYLCEKGFDARLVSATIHTPNGGRSRPGSHMSTLVYLDKAYVADVGFGDLPLQAMPLTTANDNDYIHDTNGYYRAVKENDDLFFVQKWEHDEWHTSYEATFTPRDIQDFREAMHYNQYNENSIFVKKLVITIPTASGRVTMSENDLTITSHGEKEKTPVTSENYRTFLQKYFGMDVVIKRLEVEKE